MIMDNIFNNLIILQKSHFVSTLGSSLWALEGDSREVNLDQSHILTLSYSWSKEAAFIIKMPS